MKKTRKRVVIAMSGGVDSSVAAALLKDEGYDVVGISMQVWDHSSFVPEDGKPFGTCCSLDDIHDARRVAEQLGIPFYVVNFEEEFRRLVIGNFIEEYFAGRTPNPCARCNQWIKFELLLAKARELEADFLATGHYARIRRDDTGVFHLLRGLDPAKDQSYFLFTFTQQQLARTLFPVGELTKPEVRRLAESYGLRVAEKSESQEICFIPDQDYVRFLEEERGPRLLSGEIVDGTGKVVGSHDGTYRYTVGQRKGLGIAAPNPLYVTRIDAAKRQVVVGAREELERAGFTAAASTWIVPPSFPLAGECRIRYRHLPAPCTVSDLGEGRIEVHFGVPEKGITPGQAAVFYRGDEVLGGAWIE
jgi:tRNA-uridine 2-sulfurtransferase